VAWGRPALRRCWWWWPRSGRRCLTDPLAPLLGRGH
jgi:hypothetical protein